MNLHSWPIIWTQERKGKEDLGVGEGGRIWLVGGAAWGGPRKEK